MKANWSTLVISGFVLLISGFACGEEDNGAIDSDGDADTDAGTDNEDEAPPAGEFDIAIRNGRVIDPLLRSDAIGDVYIKDGKIEQIYYGSAEATAATAETEIDAEDLIVSPGFINIHGHEGGLAETFKAHMLDGCTSIIVGNCGHNMFPFLTSPPADGFPFYINVGRLTGHSTSRELAGLTDPYSPATAAQITQMVAYTEEQMQAGSFGVSYGLGYVPGSSYEEILAVGQVAAEYGGLTACHGRDLMQHEPALDALEEMINLARDTGIPHQYSHIGSMLAYGDVMDRGLEMINEAQAEGIRITADIYPYAAWNTSIGAAIFDPPLFFDVCGCTADQIEIQSYATVNGEQVMAPGDRFESIDQFYKVRQENPNAGLIGHILNWEKIKLAMQNDYVTISTDGTAGTGHPRVAGSYSKFLGELVRDKGFLPDIVTALFKASTQAAMILGLENKGRMIEGADADITVFDYDEIIDNATFGEDHLLPPTGIRYVLVNGVLTVENGKLAPATQPAGKLLTKDRTVPGFALSDLNQ